MDQQQVSIPSGHDGVSVGPAARRSSRREWFFKFLVLIISLVVFLEGGSRLALAINPLRRRITGFDNSSYRLQWIRLHKQHMEWTGPFATYHPVRGWALKPGLRDMKVFDGTILNTNSKGMREKTDYAYERTPGERRILILGDSFTFGAEVADDQTFSHYLETHLPDTEVLNLGVQGYGHDQMLLYLKEEGIKYHPDVIIIGFTYIDLYRNIENFFAYAKPEFKLASSGLRLTNVPVPPPDHVLAWEPFRPKSLDMLVILREKLRWSLGWNEAQARALSRALLHEIVSTTRSIGAKPVLVYMPVNEEIEPFPQFGVTSYSPPVEDREKYVLTVCQNEGIPCLFLRPRFREEVSRGVDLRPRRHWNARAHWIAGEEIQNFLLRRDLLPDLHGQAAVSPTAQPGPK